MKETGTVSPLTVRQLSERLPAFTEPALRWAIFCAKAPAGSKAHETYAGLRSAIIRIGRRVLIDENRFLAWVASRRQS